MDDNTTNPERKVEVIERWLQEKPEQFWTQRGEQMALELFNSMARRVPAYQDFLRRHKVDPAQVKTITDFQSMVPPIDKDNYLRAYPREQLVWDGDLGGQAWVISTTSGSTGQPYYFPRQDLQDDQYALTAELYLKANFRIHERSTLYIVAFPMGAWIGGVFTYEAVKRVAERGYRLSIITPGINKAEVINAVKNLGADFDQIIIGSYAPFLKDILEDGRRAGIDWKSYRLGFVFSAEGFSEVFRDYVQRTTGLENIYSGTLNHYGTVDLGTMAHETPLSILLRRQALANQPLYQELFGESTRLPTLAQYLPELFYFESHDGRLYGSAHSGIPLVRYDLKDSGGVITSTEVQGLSARHGLDLAEAAKAAGIADTVWNLPYVYVYERADFSVSFYAFQIYPETIRRALQQPQLGDSITGKFTMLVKYNADGQQVFEVNAELAADQSTNPDLVNQVTELIVDQLVRDSSEYAEVHRDYGAAKVRPVVVLWPYEDPTYFRPGTKQKWVQK